MQHDEWQVKENIEQLRQLMSDQNLQLLPDYEQRIRVLKDLGFVDEESRVQLKGKVACEVWHSPVRFYLRMKHHINISNRFILPTS
jgi:superfamily II RNA helicase